MGQLAKTLTQVASEAEGKGVRILLEVINRFETNLFNTAESTVSFIKKYDIPNCLIHLDSYHMNMEEADPVQAILECGDLLGYFHVSDNTRKLPGSGIIDFKQQLGALLKIGYKGYVSVECLPEQDGVETARKSLEYLKSIDL